MGKVNQGIPKDLVEFLANEYSLSTFVEGGTYKGNTARYASQIFKNVHTIEASPIMYKIASDNLNNYKNVNVLLGDTRNNLRKIIENSNHILYWLDSHWSGGNTYGKDDECPLIEELKIIFGKKHSFVILIDDARLFTSPPPIPHKIEGWPTIDEVLSVIPKGYKVFIYEDVIYILPVSEVKIFQEFVQKKDHAISKKQLKNIIFNLINHFRNLHD